MTEWISGDVVVNGIELHYQRTGGDKPALVFSHGTTDSGLTWEPIAGEFTEYFDVVLYDRRGHGQSGAPESGYTFADQAADLVGLLETLELESAVLVGHSGGAAIAAAAAAELPDQVICLLLEDPPWGTGWGGWQAMADGLAQWFQEIITLSREALTVQCTEKNPGWSAESVSAWVEAHLQVRPEVIQEFQQPEPAWRETALKITCPVMVLASDVDLNPLMTEDDAKEIVKHFQNSRFVRIPGTGHVIHNDNPEAFKHALRAFVRDMWRKYRRNRE